ncbi:hypothetical protein HDU86_006328 [Geranomyces michiganensis]|nr:hypothetical protein HDU86_006328 [Geranomyces michiganensis]
MSGKAAAASPSLTPLNNTPNSLSPVIDSLLDSLAPPSAYTSAEADAFLAGARALRDALSVRMHELGTPPMPLPMEFAPLPPALVQLKTKKAGVDKKIEAFITAKRAQIDASNQREFLRPRRSPEDANCARVDAVQLNRTVQMKLDIAHNESGPLERSTTRAAEAGPEEERGRQRGNALSVTACANCAFLDGIEERLGNIQEHLNVSFVSRNRVDVFTRIKALEDKIVQLEEDHPAWAAFYFKQPNRDQDTDQALQRDPPQTVVTIDGAGKVHTAIIPSSSSRNIAAARTGGYGAAAATGTVPRTGSSSSAGVGGAGGGVRPTLPLSADPAAARQSPFLNPDDSSVAPSSAESIEQRIQALRESLENRQKRLRVS